MIAYTLTVTNSSKFHSEIISSNLSAQYEEASANVSMFITMHFHSTKRKLDPFTHNRFEIFLFYTYLPIHSATHVEEPMV
jgi:hypothetical protein